MAKMVARIFEQEEAIRTVLSSDRKTSHLVPTWQDIDVLQAVHTALSPLSSLTDILSAESYVTVSAVIPLLHLIEHKFLLEESSDSQLTIDIKSRIKADLKCPYSSLQEDTMILLKTATFLDPRFKSKYLESEEIDVLKEFIRESLDDVEEIVVNAVKSYTF